MTPELACPHVTLTCAYLNCNGDICGAPIVVRADSYSGYAHHAGSGNGITGWGHWPSPERYGPGAKETLRIFVKCIVCGKGPTENPQHLLYGGHKFTTRTKDRSCRQ